DHLRSPTYRSMRRDSRHGSHDRRAAIRCKPRTHGRSNTRNAIVSKGHDFSELNHSTQRRWCSSRRTKTSTTMIKQKLVKQFIVAPGSKVDLKKFTTDWAGTEGAKKLGSEKIKQRSLKILEKNREELAKVQELIYANNTRSVLLIFQAMDAAGKDGTIRHVMSGADPAR